MRKARQQKKKATARAKQQRAIVKSEDKAYAAAVVKEHRKGQPHLVWKNDAFAPGKPAPPPRLKVGVTVMHGAHEKFGAKWKGSRMGSTRARIVEAVADTGCQTCTAGIDIIENLCTEDYLIPTRHKIVGITDASLAIAGIAFFRLQAENGRETRQTVYISRNVKGLYLSESALKDLGAISEDFPRGEKASYATTIQSVADADEQCECIQRNTTPDRPDELPFAPTPENIPRFKEWLLQAFSASAFNTCAHQPLQMMTGTPAGVKFKQDAEPYAIHTPIPIPHHWKKQVKSDIDRDVRLGIIEPVPQGTPTEWCSRMVVTAKKDGSPRRTVDLQRLNNATMRETHHTPSPFNLVSTIPGGTRKTVLDAWNGYHSLPLSDDARDATTFITEWGRYRYCRAPMGFHASGDAYTRRFDDITAGESRVVRCIDDSLIWDQTDDIAATFWHAFDYIKLCGDHGVVFNREKFVFAEESVEFAGFDVHMEGVRPPQRIISAIEDFPVPRNVTDIRSWFGLVNQVSYAFAHAEVMTPFRELLASKKRTFYWDGTLEEVFQRSKQEIVKRVQEGVRTFEIDRATCLATDWSRIGVGYSLTQKHCECTGPIDPNCGGGHWKLILAGSRFTKDAETRYAPIEGEALALVYGLQSCRMFVLGSPNLTVAVDHKPLIKIFDDRQLDTIDNPRILNLKEKTLMYSFKVMHIEGISNCTSDWASRNPARGANDKERSQCHEEGISAAYAARHGNKATSVTWKTVKEAATSDEECVLLVDCIINGFPDAREGLPPSLRCYWPMREELYVIDKVPFKGRKMLVPSALRGQVLEGLHSAHQGVTGMQANARERFFWPGLDAAIRQVRSKCRQCNENAPSQPSEEMIITPPPDYPFQQVVTDFAEIEGHDFLVYADRYSGWLEVAKLNNKVWKTVHQTLLSWFDFGVPEEISSDGGPPFNSMEYESFLQRWDIRRRQSSAYYPQSNGRAEVAVKTARRILLGNINPVTGKLDTEEAARAFLAYRNTPSQDTGISPAMSLFGRPIKDHLPRRTLVIRPEWEAVQNAREIAFAKRHLASPPNKPARMLEPLLCGDAVQVQNQNGNRPRKWYATGVVVECLPNRQYRVLIDGSRRATLRNRKFLRKIDPVCRKPTHLPEIDQARPVTPTVPAEVRRTTPSEGTNGGSPAIRIEPNDPTPQRPRAAARLVPRKIVDVIEEAEQPNATLETGHDEAHDESGDMIYEPRHVPPEVREEEADGGTPIPRRGGRVRKAKVPFSPKMGGKTHF